MYVILAIVIILIFFIIYEINLFVVLKNKLKQSKSSIEVYLNQRFDLIPNLVEVVKGYAKYEENVIEKITKLRSEYNLDKNKDLKKVSILNNECNKIFAVAENIPDLKTSEQFLNLQKSLEKIEDNLQAARRLYNGDVTLYNTAISTFPNSIIARICGLKKEELFEIEEYKKSDVKIDL